MSSAVAMKSNIFSSFSYSADEQGCRSWEGAQPGRQLKLASGNTPYHRRHAQFMNSGWPGSKNPFLLSSVFHEFKLFHEFGLFSVSMASSAKFMSL